MNKWENFINKRRDYYAYNRLKNVIHTSYDPTVDAFVLEKQELTKKNLNKMYMYEPVEPLTYVSNLIVISSSLGRSSLLNINL